MVYNNFLIRIIFSIFIFIIYFYSIKDKFFLLIFGGLIYLIIFIEIKNNFKKYFNIIILYLIISLINFVIYIYYFFDFYLFNILVFVIISFDTLSYLFGNFFGKTYAFKSISPNKTLEGYIGGIFFSNIFYLIYVNINTNFADQLINIILINFIIFFSILGDLIQSIFKRKNNIKNSSNFLPGHGGFFDRFDSFIPSIIFLTLYSFYYS